MTKDKHIGFDTYVFPHSSVKIHETTISELSK